MDTKITPEVENLHDRLMLGMEAMLADLRPGMIELALAGPMLMVWDRLFRSGRVDWHAFGPELHTEARRFVAAKTDSEVLALIGSPMVNPDSPEAVLRGEMDPRDAATLALMILLEEVCLATMETLRTQAETPRGESVRRAKLASGRT